MLDIGGDDSGNDLPFQSSPHSKMPDIQISKKGTECLLKKLNPHKAAGPDQIKPIVLQTLHKELAPILQVIFQRSVNQGKLPNIWKDANVSPVFSLTCVLCKVLEHIVASSLSRHFTVFMNYSTGSEKGGPARPSWSCLLMNYPKICKWGNRQI